MEGAFRPPWRRAPVLCLSHGVTHGHVLTWRIQYRAWNARMPDAARSMPPIKPIASCCGTNCVTLLHAPATARCIPNVSFGCSAAPVDEDSSTATSCALWVQGNCSGVFQLDGTSRAVQCGAGVLPDYGRRTCSFTNSVERRLAEWNRAPPPPLPAAQRWHARYSKLDR